MQDETEYPYQIRIQDDFSEKKFQKETICHILVDSVSWTHKDAKDDEEEKNYEWWIIISHMWSSEMVYKIGAQDNSALLHLGSLYPSISV